MLLPNVFKLYPSARPRLFGVFIALLMAFGGGNLLHATPVATQTTLAVSPSTGTVPTKTVVTLTATVVNASTSGPITQGTVYFYDTLSTFLVPSAGTGAPQPLVLGRAQVTSAGTATIRTILPSATHTLVAVYMPTPQGLGSASTSATVTAAGGGNEQATIITTVAGNKLGYTLRDDVRYQGVTAPTGTLNIYDNTASAMLATTTHITDQGPLFAGAGFSQGTLPSLPNGSSGAVYADMNNDGIPDLISIANAQVSVAFGVGDGTFSAATSYSVPSGGATSLDVGDMDSDGHIDVVIADSGNHAVDVLLNNGSGGLGSGTMYTVTSPSKVIVGDFGSGYLDIATLQRGAGSMANVPTGVNILTNSGVGTFGSPTLLNIENTTIYAVATDFAAGDFNGDGHLDLALVSNGAVNAEQVVFMSNGNGGFNGALTASSNFFNGGNIQTGDYNGDGVTDFAAMLPNGSVNIFSGANGGFSGVGYLAISFGQIVSADFDGNGWVDTVWTTGPGFKVDYGVGYQTGFYPVPAVVTAGPFTSAASGTASTGSLLGDGLKDLFFAGGPPAEWLSYNDVTPVYPAASTSEQPIALISTTSLAPHTITVSYVPPAGGSYGPATANTVQIYPMGQVTPSVNVSPTTINYNTSSTTAVLTATMASLSGTVPTGSITFMDNGSAIGTATLNGSGVATYSLIRPTGASHAITAVYQGDSNYIAQTSAAASFTVTPETPTVSVTTSLSSQIVAGAVTLTGTLSAINTGVAGVTLQFDIAGANGATCTITTSGSTGSCSVQTVVPSSGTLTVHASNVLDTSAQPNLLSGTATTTITGTQSAANFTIQTSINPSYQTQSVNITVTAPSVSGVYPNGTLTVLDNGVSLQTISFASASSVTFSNSSFATGSHVLTTHYNGDTGGRTLPNGYVTSTGSFLAGTGPQSVTQSVVAFTVAVQLSVTPQNVSQGTLQQISANVNSGGVALTGDIVEFHDAAAHPTLLGYGFTNSSGIASLPQIFSPGQHSIYAVATVTGSTETSYTSSPVAVTVTPGTTFPLSLNLAVTGAPGSYISTVTASYMGSYPLGALALQNVSNGNSALSSMSFGAPVFTPPTGSSTSLTAGIGGLMSVVGDVNNDGKQDIVVANYLDETLSVYLGNGDGTFQPPNVISLTNNSPNSLALRDIDNDGNLDIVTVCDWQQSGTIYFGDGTGNFNSGLYSINIPFAVTDHILIDLNNDGLLDDVSVGFNTWINIQQNGTGFFSDHPGGNVNGEQAMWVAAADFNGDGFPDVVTGNYGGGTNTTNSVSILLNDGTGSFTPALIDLPGAPGGVTTGDFDEDGNMDFAVALYDTQQIAIFRGVGDGTFHPAVLISAGGTTGAQSIKAVDYDGDGSLDLVLLDTATTIGEYSGGAPLPPFSGPGNLYTTTSSGNVLYLRGDGQGNFDPAQTIPVGAGTTPYSLSVADLNGDGLPDLEVTQSSGFDNLNNVSTPSTVSILLGTNRATAVLTGSSAVNTAGPVQIRAHYTHGSPDAYPTANSNTVQLQSLTTAAVSSSLNPSPLGASLTLTATVATVTGVVPTGTVQIFDGSTSLGTATLSSGVGSVTTSSLTLGGHTITAFYNGDSHFQAVAAAALSQTISPAATTVTLTSSSNPANYGSSVTLTATLGNNSATGTVRFLQGSTLLGSSQVVSGVATFATSSLPLGTSSLTASYLGDSNNSAAASSVLSQVISKSNAATVTLAISPTSAASGSSISMTATLAAGAATGTVSFTSGGNQVGLATVSNGVATFDTTTLPVGSYSVVAVYSGDSSYNTQTSSAASLTITQATTTLNAPYASPASPSYGQTVTLYQPVPPGATGTVTFSVNGSSIGTATIANGVASITTSSLAVGTSAITTAYSGNSSYTSANSPSFALTVSRATASLPAPTASPTSGALGVSVTLTQTAPTGLTGTITFLNNGVSIGTGTVVSGVATLTTTSLPVGSNSITTTFAGNANYTAATSPSTPVTITAPSTSMTLSGPSTGSYGVSVTFTATLTASSGPAPSSGTVNFLVGSLSIGTGSISSGVASLATSTLPVGSTTIIANYATNSSYGGSTAIAGIVVSQGSVTLSAPTYSPSSPVYGGTVTLSQAAPTGVTGTITFLNNGVSIGTGTVAGGIATLTTTSLPVGSNSITTTFPGNANYASATSPSTSVTVAQATPTLSAPTFSPASPTYGQTVTLTQPVPTGVTGSLNFYNGSTLLGSAAINSGIATFTTTLPGGSNSITTGFAGNVNFAAATSAAAIVTVAAAAPNLAAPSISPTTAPYGTTVTLTQAVPAGMTGTITFYSGSTFLGGAGIANGVAYLLTSNLPGGTNSITTSYGGNANFAAGTSSAASIAITPATVSLSAPTISPSSSAYGTSVTITQAVPNGVTGTVNFYNASNLIGSGTISSGAATLTTTSLPVGTDPITALYLGDPNHNSASAGPVNATVSAAPSTTTLSSSTNSASYGTLVTLTSTVMVSGNPLTSGTVTFASGSTTLGASPLNGSGIATLVLTTMPVGSNPVSASIAASGNYNTSVSSTVIINITQATLTLNAPSLSPSTTTYGSPVTITQAVPTGVTGTLSFYSGSILLGTGTVTGNTASLVTSAIPAGTSAITTSFGGNANYTAATSAAQNITVTQATPSLPAPMASPTSATYGTPVALTQTVPAGATGTVTFYSGSTLLGAGTISGGVATLTTTALPGGSNAVTASFPGSANYTAATSGATTVSITPATLQLSAPSATPSGASFGAPVILTQTVPTGVTGTITFSSGSSVLGTATVSGGVATLTTTALPAGSNSVTASFPGNANYSAATSPSTTVTITGGSTSTSLSATPNSAAYSSPVVLAATVTSTGTPLTAGTVQFLLGGVSLGSATVSNSGVATLTTTVLPTGSNAITASFAGTSNFAASTSAATTVTITPAAVSLTAPTASPTTAAYGGSVTLTQPVPAGVTGTITFFSGSTVLGTGTITGGVAVLSTTALPVGSNSITTSFPGNTNFAAGTSAATAVTITQAAVSLTAPTASTATAAYGASVTLTQPVPAGVTGTITFLSGSTVLGTGTITGGVAVLTTTALPVGSNSITTSFPGNTNFAAGTSAATAVTITQAAVSLTAPTASTATAAYGASVTLTQPVPAGVTGTITFLSGSTVLGTGTITGGVAVLTTTALPVGSNSITTSFPGNTNFAAGTSSATTVTISSGATSTSLTATPSSAAYGASVVLTATVTSAGTPLTAGSVQFLLGSVSLGSAAVNGSGIATLTTSTLPVGSNSVAADFSGTTAFAASNSTATPVTISQAATSLAAPSASPTAAAFGSSVTLTQAVPAGVTGTITFLNGTTVLGTATIAGGTASLATTTLPVGSNSITASFGGNTNFAAGTSAATAVTITQAAAPALPAPSASTTTAAYGTSVTFTQSVPAGVTGTITFFNGTTVLGSATITGGVATLTTATLPVGTNSITASFPGNINFAAGTSAPTVVTITALPTSTALTASASTGHPGDTITLSANVSMNGAPVSAGTVNFLLGSTSLGSAGVGSAGLATLATTALPLGADSITATFTGAAGLAASTSAAVTVTITSATPPGYSISANPPSLTIHSGGTGSTVLTVTPVGGITGSVTLACNGLPVNATCQFTQNGVANATVVMDGTNQPLQVGLAVKTGVVIASQDAHPLRRSMRALALMLPCGLLGLLAFRGRRRTLPQLLAIGLLLLAGSSALSGCGGGGFGTNSTPKGTSVATVTATATATGTGSAMPAQTFSLTITIVQ